MSLEPENVSEEPFEDGCGSLRSCLVEGDPEQRRSERRVRRRALVISVLLQSAALTLLVLVPLFGKTERIAVKDFVPLPPYGHPKSRPRGNVRSAPSLSAAPDLRFKVQPPTSRTDPRPAGAEPAGDTPDLGSTGGERENGPNCGWCVDLGDKTSNPNGVQLKTETPPTPQVVHVTSLNPAMLIHRVEPVYPVLARQVHREGRVELRAIIGTDGTIQSLEIVAGDPLFQRSAREAVQQWRYKPTILNGQAVEIDTYITVIYTLDH